MAIELGTIDGYSVMVASQQGGAREYWESKALESEIPFGLSHREIWDRITLSRDAWLLVITDAQHEPQAALCVRAHASYALPFHRVLRVERFAGARDPEAERVALSAARRFAESLPLVIRLHMELFDPTGERVDAMASAAKAVGFRKWHRPRIYDRTVTLDLTRDPDAIFSELHRTGRRHIRSKDKNPVEIQVLGPDFPARRLQELFEETLGRTGGSAQPQPWTDILELGKRFPELSRSVGLIRKEPGRPDTLLAFAWACHHGDHAHYSTAASTRVTDLKIAMGYPLAWDLILWAKRNGARIFDFGGISPGTGESDDPLGGISDFKRRFTTHVVEVGQEWVYEPRPMRSRLAGWISGLRYGS